MQVEIACLSASNEVLSTVHRTVGGGFKGGQKESDYDHPLLRFLTPTNSAWVQIKVHKGRTESSESSFVFFARPELTLAANGGGRRPAATLPRATANLLRSSGAVEVFQALLAPPAEMFDAARITASLMVTAGPQKDCLSGLSLERANPPEIAEFSIKGSIVKIVGRGRQEGSAEVTIGVYVDNELSATTCCAVSGSKFTGTAYLDPKHLDGQPHGIQARLLPEQTPLAFTHQILPFQITPWDSIQRLSKPPIDPGLSTAARQHLRSYQAWLSNVATDGSRPLPPLAALHDELLQGFKKRPDYPPLAFPESEAPAVSIIIPVHNKFEVTYFCLCSLLFAYNDTSFEVVVVDDGSTDETVDLGSTVSGIRVVKHPSALGFVHSCNDGASIARGRYVCFLNNDIEVTARWLDELVGTFDDFDDIGLVGSKLVYPDGKLQEAGGIVWGSGNPWNVGRNGNPEDPRYNYLRQVDYLSGASILISKELWDQVGGFSPEYAPGYFEDTDLAMKVRQAGRRVVYVPTSVVTHFEGQTSGTSVAGGMKRFQEINRPKFKEKWIGLYSTHGTEGQRPEREKDRNVTFRVLFVDHRFPMVDSDAGAYASFQEIRLLQSLGAQVTFLPRNLAWMDRHTRALQRIGVECLHAPFVVDFVNYVREHAAEYDVVFACRYRIGEEIVAAVRSSAPNTKFVLNLADLHFLREFRESAAGSPGYTYDRAKRTRDAELATVMASDLTLSYTDVEISVLESHLTSPAKLARLPWVVETAKRPRKPFSQTKDILFLGGFGHPPNVQAVKFFAAEVMPQLRKTLPDVVFNVVGSSPTPEVLALASDAVQITGYVADLEEVFDASRIFVAPLLAGAGIKGKVLEGIARGAAMVLSHVAAEGTGLVDGVDCLIAKTPEEWATAVARLYGDEPLWATLGANAQRAAETRFSFEAGAELMRSALAKVDVFGTRGLYYKHARPQSYLV
jgi:GT2 family glycosyltransferase